MGYFYQYLLSHSSSISPPCPPTSWLSCTQPPPSSFSPPQTSVSRLSRPAPQDPVLISEKRLRVRKALYHNFEIMIAATYLYLHNKFIGAKFLIRSKFRLYPHILGINAVILLVIIIETALEIGKVVAEETFLPCLYFLVQVLRVVHFVGLDIAIGLGLLAL